MTRKDDSEGTAPGRAAPDGGTDVARVSTGTAEVDPTTPTGETETPGSVRRRLGRLRTPSLSRLNRWDLLAYAVYVVSVIFFVFPVAWVVSMSLRPESAVFTYPVELIPPTVTLDPYRRVLAGGMVRWLINSTVVSVWSVVTIVLVTIPTAYAFSRFSFSGRRWLLLLVLVFQMISPVIIVIPMYSVMSALGLLESHLGLVLLYVGLQVPFSVWLMKGYFDTVPVELDQAARIDGCNRLQTLVYVLLRPVMPGIVVVAIFNFVLTWSEFVMAYTVLSDGDLFTIAIGVYEFQGQYGNDWPAIAAASVLGMVPMVLVFLALQRYFVAGLIGGSLKG